MQLPLTTTESYIIISLYRIVTDLDRKTKMICQKNGLTMGQFMVLEALYHKGAMTIGEVKERILSTDGTIPVIVRNMEKAQLIPRRQDEKDRRKFMLDLTDQGREVIARVYPENAELLKKALSAWPPEAQKTLQKLLRQYRAQNL